MELLTTFPWSFLGLLLISLISGLYLSNQDLLETQEEDEVVLKPVSSKSKKKFCKNTSSCS